MWAPSAVRRSVMTARRTAVASLLVALVASAGTSGCSSRGCGSGEDTASGAVTAFLKAGPEAAGEADVCRWVPEAVKADGWKLAQELAAPVKAAGADSLTVEEVPGSQEGSVHTVRVAGAQLPVSTFLVMDEDGRFLIAPAESMGSAAGG